MLINVMLPLYTKPTFVIHSKIENSQNSLGYKLNSRPQQIHMLKAYFPGNLRMWLYLETLKELLLKVK